MTKIINKTKQIFAIIVEERLRLFCCHSLSGLQNEESSLGMMSSSGVSSLS